MGERIIEVYDGQTGQRLPDEVEVIEDAVLTRESNERDVRRQARDLLQDVRAVRRRAAGNEGTLRADMAAIAAGTSGLSNANQLRALGNGVVAVLDGMAVLARVESILMRIEAQDFTAGTE